MNVLMLSVLTNCGQGKITEMPQEEISEALNQAGYVMDDDTRNSLINYVKNVCMNEVKGKYAPKKEASGIEQ